jgi:hypothetical protein
MIEKLKIENPEIADNDRLIGKKLRQSYTFMPPQDKLDDMTDDEVDELQDEVKLSAIKLKRDAATYRNQMGELLTKVSSEQLSSEDLTAKRQQIAAEWEEPSKTIIPKEIPIPIDEWDKELLKFSVDKDDLSKLGESVKKYASDNQIPYTNANYKMIGDQIMASYVLEKLPKIMRVALDNMAAEIQLATDRKYTNPSASKKTESKSGKGEPDVNLKPLIG